MPTYKDINLLTQKSSVAGTEKLPVSDTEYITPDQIAKIAGNQTTIWGQSYDGTANVSGSLSGVTDITLSGNITVTGENCIKQKGKYNSPTGNLQNMSGLHQYADRIIAYASSYGVAEALSGQSGNYYIQAGEWDGSAFYNILLSPFGGNVGIRTASPSYALDVNGDIRATSFIKSGGTSSQFLKADGSVDSNTYATTTDLANAVGDIETLLAAI